MAIVSSQGFLHQAEAYIGAVGVQRGYSKLCVLVVSEWKRSHRNRAVSAPKCSIRELSHWRS